MALGADLIDNLATPLGVLLDSARWLAAEVADAVEVELRRSWRWLRTRHAEVTLADLQFAAGDVLATGGQAVRAVQEDLQLRWSEIISAGATAELHLLQVPGYAPLADALFGCPGPLRWAASRQHSPDLLLARTANSATRWVLGELHVAMNTVESRLFRTQCDDPCRAGRVDRPRHEPRSGGADVPSARRRGHGRTSPPTALDPPGQYRYWSYDADDGRAEGTASVPATAVTVRGGRPACRPGRGAWLERPGAGVLRRVPERARGEPVHDPAPRDAPVPGPHRRSGDLPGELELPGIRRAGSGRGGDGGFQLLRDWAASADVPRHVFVRTRGVCKFFLAYFSFVSRALCGTRELAS